ncbi:MAG: molybdate ABC transporter substrate-binding protein [Oculatellaceae cyanobacterium Prado106]|jgi:molybdate transport system substrate-binding protein|nr:molybdate ABC transporter substrate-binding protein [Oculatellaceae cyanobacterium Prado106]
MNTRRTFKFLALMTIAAIALIVGFRLFSPSLPTAQAEAPLLISSAASLKETLESVKPLYEKSQQEKQPAVNVNYNFGASGALQQQILNGAPADIFISAGKKQMDALEQQGLLVPGTRQNFVTNRLVLIVPGNATGVTRFEDLAKAEVRRVAIGEPRSVPAGQYAEETLKNLKIWEQVQPKFMMASNVRQVLAAVESGNADAGLVYATDARISAQVRVVATAAENLHAPIVYPMAVLKRTQNLSAAKAYLEFLASDATQAVMKQAGFNQ